MRALVLLYNKVFNFWMRFPQKIRFLLVGGYNTLFSYLIYVFFVYMGVNAQLSLFLSFLISSVNSYLTQKFYVFNTKGNYIWEYVKCLSTWVVSYFINAFLLFVMMRFMLLNPYISQFIALVILTIYSYIALKCFAFQKVKKK